MNNVWTPVETDWNLSPYTGLTKASWLDASRYMLNGVFSNIKNFEDPVVMPRKETEITYPHLKASEEVQHSQRLAEMFEGLTRSFFIAAPLIANDPDVTLNGYLLRDYYKAQVLRTCTPGDPVYIGLYEDQMAFTGSDRFRPFQQTVETCALVICLWISREQIWDTYTKEEKDVIAALLENYAHNSTVPQNWRLFNMLDMAFLNMNGYPIDKDIMREHAKAIAEYYVGDGWYRDGHHFDYYSCWAFNVYAPIWNEWYGYENEPYLAKVFEDNSNELMKTYPDFFDADGFTNMWGRSNIYRNAATSAFEGNFFLKSTSVDPGLARRIASGSLLQFLTRDDFLFNGIPTLGFYGQYSPLVQGYSCAESPFWLGKAFLCLHLPDDHPFWTAKENNGTFDRLPKSGIESVKETTLDGPALCFTNHGATGETILRTGKAAKRPDDLHGMWNYLKLSYNTKYPWEATPLINDVQIPGKAASENVEPEDRKIVKGDVESLQYVLIDRSTGERQIGNYNFWCNEIDGVLYRRQFFKYVAGAESHWFHALNLADFPVECGIVRVDKMRLHRRPVTFTLGSYGFPDNNTTVAYKEKMVAGNGKQTAKAVILKGYDHTGKPRQMAMTIYDGWDDIYLTKSTETNPDSTDSLVIYGVTTREKHYGYDPYCMISQVITKESHEDFTEDELFAIKSIEYTDPEKCGGYGPVTVNMIDGRQMVVDYNLIESRLSI